MGDRRVTLNALVMPTIGSGRIRPTTHGLPSGTVLLMPRTEASDCTCRGAPAGRRGWGDGRDHLSRVVNLAAREPLSPQVQTFLDFATGSSAAEVWNRHFSSIR